LAGSRIVSDGQYVLPSIADPVAEAAPGGMLTGVVSGIKDSINITNALDSNIRANNADKRQQVANDYLYNEDRLAAELLSKDIQNQKQQLSLDLDIKYADQARNLSNKIQELNIDKTKAEIDKQKATNRVQPIIDLSNAYDKIVTTDKQGKSGGSSDGGYVIGPQGPRPMSGLEKKSAQGDQLASINDEYLNTASQSAANNILSSKIAQTKTFDVLMGKIREAAEDLKFGNTDPADFSAIEEPLKKANLAYEQEQDPEKKKVYREQLKQVVADIGKYNLEDYAKATKNNKLLNRTIVNTGDIQGMSTDMRVIGSVGLPDRYIKDPEEAYLNLSKLISQGSTAVDDPEFNDKLRDSEYVVAARKASKNGTQPFKVETDIVDVQGIPDVSGSGGSQKLYKFTGLDGTVSQASLPGDDPVKKSELSLIERYASRLEQQVSRAKSINEQLPSVAKQEVQQPVDNTKLLVDAAKTYGVDPELMYAISGIESSFGTNLKKNPESSAMGSMQIIKGTFEGLEGRPRTVEDEKRLMSDPAYGYELGAKLLSQLQTNLGTKDPKIIALGHFEGQDVAEQYMKSLKTGKPILDPELSQKIQRGLNNYNVGLQRASKTPLNTNAGPQEQTPLAANDSKYKEIEGIKFKETSVTPDDIREYESGNYYDENSGLELDNKGVLEANKQVQNRYKQAKTERDKFVSEQNKEIYKAKEVPLKNFKSSSELLNELKRVPQDKRDVIGPDSVFYGSAVEVLSNLGVNIGDAKEDLKIRSRLDTATNKRIFEKMSGLIGQKTVDAASERKTFESSVGSTATDYDYLQFINGLEYASSVQDLGVFNLKSLLLDRGLNISKDKLESIAEDYKYSPYSSKYLINESPNGSNNYFRLNPNYKTPEQYYKEVFLNDTNKNQALEVDKDNLLVGGAEQQSATTPSPSEQGIPSEDTSLKKSENLGSYSGATSSSSSSSSSGGVADAVSSTSTGGPGGTVMSKVEPVVNNDPSLANKPVLTVLTKTGELDRAEVLRIKEEMQSNKLGGLWDKIKEQTYNTFALMSGKERADIAAEGLKETRKLVGAAAEKTVDGAVGLVNKSIDYLTGGEVKNASEAIISKQDEVLNNLFNTSPEYRQALKEYREEAKKNPGIFTKDLTPTEDVVSDIIAMLIPGMATEKFMINTLQAGKTLPYVGKLLSKIPAIGENIISNATAGVVADQFVNPDTTDFNKSLMTNTLFATGGSIAGRVLTPFAKGVYNYFSNTEDIPEALAKVFVQKGISNAERASINTAIVQGMSEGKTVFESVPEAYKDIFEQLAKTPQGASVLSYYKDVLRDVVGGRVDDMGKAIPEVGTAGELQSAARATVQGQADNTLSKLKANKATEVEQANKIIEQQSAEELSKLTTNRATEVEQANKILEEEALSTVGKAETSYLGAVENIKGSVQTAIKNKAEELAKVLDPKSADNIFSNLEEAVVDTGDARLDRFSSIKADLDKKISAVESMVTDGSEEGFGKVFTAINPKKGDPRVVVSPEQLNKFSTAVENLDLGASTPDDSAIKDLSSLIDKTNKVTLRKIPADTELVDKLSPDVNWLDTLRGVLNEQVQKGAIKDTNLVKEFRKTLDETIDSAFGGNGKYQEFISKYADLRYSALPEAKKVSNLLTDIVRNVEKNKPLGGLFTVDNQDLLIKTLGKDGYKDFKKVISEADNNFIKSFEARKGIKDVNEEVSKISDKYSIKGLKDVNEEVSKISDKDLPKYFSTAKKITAEDAKPYYKTLIDSDKPELIDYVKKALPKDKEDVFREGAIKYIRDTYEEFANTYKDLGKAPSGFSSIQKENFKKILSPDEYSLVEKTEDFIKNIDRYNKLLNSSDTRKVFEKFKDSIKNILPRRLYETDSLIGLDLLSSKIFRTLDDTNKKALSKVLLGVDQNNIAETIDKAFDILNTSVKEGKGGYVDLNVVSGEELKQKVGTYITMLLIANKDRGKKEKKEKLKNIKNSILDL
jgi:hypothetical protein